ncbi:DNA-3-methyladenine glycosylase I [Streptomyces violaceusniger]|uniref:DNA-3-methyladenine glycosylase I n=1 Tax=Streptomyces violaceusniger TaxID=68280 RepID=UPI000996653B|nr:DNA-3-methyladenine glycosylase I [Streptomyces hygroscopicus]AQW49233.1 DNA-3-methyladenine glycosylase I [Streptomyces hygroscopicus]
MTDRRCAWALSSEVMAAYHDTEWGRPAHDDQHLFEMLLLEGAQAGLSWSTVLNKRENYRRALDGFDPEIIASYDQSRLADLLANDGIIRNRLKIASTVKNARAFLGIREAFGSFDTYLWDWVKGTPIVNHPAPGDPLPGSTDLSDRIAKDLKRRGFTFVGTTIVYAYLQAVGVVDDHVDGCPAKSRQSRPSAHRTHRHSHRSTT